MNPSPETVVFRLIGTPADGGLVRLHDFTDFCKAIEQVLRETEKSITENDTSSIQYRVSDLQCKSAMIALEGVPPRTGRDRRAEVLNTVRATCARIQSGQRFEREMPPQMIHAYRELARPILKSIGRTADQQHAIRIDGLELTSSFVANIDKLTKRVSLSCGSFSGRLERINMHNKSEFVIYPPVGGTRIICNFKAELLEQVRSALKRHVTVSGKMHYVNDNPFPDRVDVEGLIIHELSDTLPRLEDMAGKLSGLPKDSVSLVRELRDE